MPTSLPNLLTLARIAVLPPLAGTFFVEGEAARWVAFLIFVGAAVTDYLDGHLARRLSLESDFGRLFDPIADKLLVGTSLFMLGALGGLSALGIAAALAILAREILVSGLREFLAERRHAGRKAAAIPVSRLAKWKTAAQMVAIALLLLGEGSVGGLAVRPIGEALLWLAALLTLVTGYVYLRAAVADLDGPQGATVEETARPVASRGAGAPREARPASQPR